MGGARRTVDLGRVEIAVLATGVLALVPGARGALAWAWLWLVPGWFFARKVLRAEGFALVALTPALSIALAPLIALPSVVAAGRPVAPLIVASIAVFAIACSARRCAARVAFPRVPWPAVPALALFAVFVAVHVALAAAQPHASPERSDARYLVGIVRELAAAFPPRNPIAAGAVLKQPWGYWLLYALTHVASGVAVSGVLALASVLAALAFVVSIYVLVFVVTRDRRAASFALVLAMGSSDLAWLEALATQSNAVALDWSGLGVVTPPVNLLHGFYDVPALVLVTLVLVFVALLDRARERRAPLVIAGLLLAETPWFHPAYAFVLGLSLALAFAWDLVTSRRAPPVSLAWLALTPVPFLLLFVGLYAHGVHARAPFSLAEGATLGERARFFVRYAGLDAPLAVVGAVAASRARTSGRRPPLAQVSAALGLAAASLAIFFVSFARNYHWAYDALFVALVILGGPGLSWLYARSRAAALVFSGLTLLGAASSMAAYARAPAPPPSPAIAAGAWIRAHTPARAVFAVAPDSQPSVAAALGYGGRALFFGPAYLLATTTSPADLAALARDNDAILRDPCSSVARARGVDYVVLERRAPPALLDAWSRSGALAFEGGGLFVYAPAACGR